MEITTQFRGYGISIWDDGHLLEDTGDGYTASWMCLMPLNSHLKIVKMISVIRVYIIVVLREKPTPKKLRVCFEIFYALTSPFPWQVSVAIDLTNNWHLGWTSAKFHNQIKGHSWRFRFFICTFWIRMICLPEYFLWGPNDL